MATVSQQSLQISTSYRTLWGYFRTPLIWRNILIISLTHLIACYTMLTFPYTSHWRTFCWSILVAGAGGFGVTAGAHRLWTHRAYKARWPMRILLAMLYEVAGHNSLYDWVRDHRLHHKFCETDADPHNMNRGFFFAHVGWLMMRKHPEVLKHGREVDCSDLLDDPVVVFFLKYDWAFKFIFCFVLPTAVPIILWNESIYWSFMHCMFRYTAALNIAWLVNSAAHMFGDKPYNNLVKIWWSLLAMGEGWHNYHHTFPWDYKAAELGNHRANLTTLFIDFCAKLGLAYDLKSPSTEVIKKTLLGNGVGLQKFQ